jgi:D-tyrosyl-tRNA(Tyr) deacylase
VNSSPVGSIGDGLAVLVGVADGDTVDDALAMADKLTGLRIFRDAAGKMNRSVVDAGGAVLLISQFTLLADVRKGRRPSFVGAAAPDFAAPLITAVRDRLAAAGIETATGEFGAMMEVELVNDGPVTILIETTAGRVV